MHHIQTQLMYQFIFNHFFFFSFNNWGKMQGQRYFTPPYFLLALHHTEHVPHHFQHTKHDHHLQHLPHMTCTTPVNVGSVTSIIYSRHVTLSLVPLSYVACPPPLPALLGSGQLWCCIVCPTQCWTMTCPGNHLSQNQTMCFQDPAYDFALCDSAFIKECGRQHRW